KGTNPFVVQVNGALTAARLGLASPPLTPSAPQYAGDQTGSLDPGGLFLTAVGPGDVSFAAWQPGVNDVFAFIDRSLAGPAAATYSYLVAGWYSDPTAANGDPLFAAGDAGAFADALRVLQWSLASAAPAPPYVTVCHGLATGVAWQPGLTLGTAA